MTPRNLTPLRVYTDSRLRPTLAVIYERNPHGIYLGPTVTAYRFELGGDRRKLAKASAIEGELISLGLIRPDA